MDYIANYVDQRNAFSDFCRQESPQRILFFEGTSGSGKTSLIRNCISRLPQDVQCIPFDCKQSAITISEFFSRTSDRLGFGDASHFRKALAEIGAALESLNVANIHQEGDRNTINIALDTEFDLQERNQSILTEAWFRDVEKAEDLVLLVFDTFEQADERLSRWLSSTLLSRVANSGNVRVLVAGQRLPDPNNIEWGHVSRTCQLIGISDPKEWMAVAVAIGRQVPGASDSDQLMYMSGVCQALNGRPSDITNLIVGLPAK